MSDVTTVISEPQHLTVIVPQAPQLHSTMAVGQGPAGPKGDSGEIGGHYEHTQSLQLDVWTVNHNLGFRPSVTILSVGGVEMVAEIIHTSTNQVLVYFDQPRAGLALCS